MPIADSLRNQDIQSIQNYAITDNPVFKVKIRSLATPYEQRPERDDVPKRADEIIKTGDSITGEERDSGKIMDGIVISIEKNFYKIKKDSKFYFLNKKTCKKIEKRTKGLDQPIPFVPENKSFKNFLIEQKNIYN